MATPPTVPTGDLRQSDALVIVSTMMLQEFYETNSAQTIVTSGKILTMLLQNAIQQAEDPTKKRRIRLTNPKIKQHIVDVSGALDILGVAGFVQDTSGEYLIYSPQTRNALELYLQDESQSQEEALIQAICDGLQQVKLKELEPTLVKKKATNPTKLTTNNNNNPFLSEPDRLLRMEKAKAMKKAKKAEREATKQRWNETMQDRKEAEQRREALLNSKVEAEAKQGLAANITVKSNKVGGAGVLPKPFEDPKDQLAAAARARAERAKGASIDQANDPQAIRRRVIQETMKDSKLSAKEKQEKVQELIKAGPEALLALVSPEMEMAAKEDNATDEQEDQKPAAKTIAPPQPTNDLITARAPSPPSDEWTQFVDQVPRCAPAQGIRDTSVFQQQSDMTVPQCLKRLFKELDGLQNCLPSDPNCSIWLRFDEETPQYIRALLAAPLPGPTPYSGGVFCFDIYVPNDYPHSSPRVLLLTTGGGRVRFGPNLYADGKVCLSLLGTWSGPKWNPKQSSLYQVLISIQGLILGVEHPYYLEPGHGGWEGKVKDGDFQVKGQTLSGESMQQEVGVPMEVILYEDLLRVGAVKYAMHQPLHWAMKGSTNQNGLEAFNEIIQAHFSENRSNILAEVRTWMSDHALGRNRSTMKSNYAAGIRANAKTKSLPIDELQKLFPRLQGLLEKACMPKSSGTVKAAPPAAASAPVQDGMESEEEDSKPAARPSSPSTKRDKEQSVATNAKRNKTEAKPPPPATAAAASGADVIEQKRQQMQEAAGKGDYVLAGRLQEEVKRLEELQQSMQEAAQQNDFIRAGRLQAQFKALTVGNTSTTPRANQQSTSAWNDDEDDDDDDHEGMGDDDDDSEMEDGGPPFASLASNMGAAMGGHNLGKNVFAPPGYNSHKMSTNHSWGGGSQLGSSATAPAAAAQTATAVETTKKAAPKKVIPPDQLCRLRIRLPQNKSVVEDFDKNDSLSAVYRRLEPLVPAEDRKQGAVAGPAVAGAGGAFSQPLSSAGFTLLLTRPKREFSLEMHGTKSLVDLNLAPSATLTVMKCKDRGIMYRGEVESRLQGAEGDAMDVEGLTYEGLMELTERVGKAAPKEGSAFLTLTTEQFEANTEKFSPSTFLADLDDSMEEAGENDRRCPICLGGYDPTDTTPSLRKVKNCGHIMHSGCLETWLGTNSSCPLCKTTV